VLERDGLGEGGFGPPRGIEIEDLYLPQPNAAGRPGLAEAGGAAAPGAGNAPIDLDPAGGPLPSYIEQLERAAIPKALEENRWNKTRAAAQLGITFRALRYKLKKLGME
jgi:two-component system response regulator PilR (NtrC family)